MELTAFHILATKQRLYSEDDKKSGRKTACISVRLSIGLTVCLFLRLSISLSIRLFVCLPV